MIQNTLFSMVKAPPKRVQEESKPILNGLYYHQEQQLYVSYMHGIKYGEWNDEHFKEQGFTLTAMKTVKEKRTI